MNTITDRVMYVSDIPETATMNQLIRMFDTVLGEDSVVFADYPFSENDKKLHRGHAFILLALYSDIRYCIDRRYREEWYIGKGENCTRVSMRRAFVNGASSDKYDEKHLIFSLEEESISEEFFLEDFKEFVLGVAHNIGIEVVKCEAIMLMDSKNIHLYTADVDSASVVRMFCDKYRENGRTIRVRHAVKNLLKDEPRTTRDKKLVLEPFDMNDKFGVPYRPK